jgi:putative methyltransferase (TIGR04325 family)
MSFFSFISNSFRPPHVPASTTTPVYDRVASQFELVEGPPVWDHPAWLEASAQYVTRLRADAKNNSLVPEAYLAPIALLISTRCQLQGTLRILDLGGGLGPCFSAITRNLENVEYHIVDGKNSCAKGQELYKDDPRVSFSTSLLDQKHLYDIGMFSSALQYIEDWKAALADVERITGDFLILNRMPVFFRPTLAIRQNLYLGEPLACIGVVWHWIFSYQELLDEVSRLGFGLVYEQFIRNIGEEVAQTESLGRVDLRLLVFKRNVAQSRLCK